MNSRGSLFSFGDGLQRLNTVWGKDFPAKVFIVILYCELMYEPISVMASLFCLVPYFLWILVFITIAGVAQWGRSLEKHCVFSHTKVSHLWDFHTSSWAFFGPRLSLALDTYSTMMPINSVDSFV